MLNSPKKYRGIKFLNVDQKFLNIKVLNKKKAQKSLSINTPILNNGTNEKSLKSSANDYPYKTEEEKSPLVRNYSNKKSSKKLFSSKGINSINSIQIKDSNIYKIIKRKNIEDKKDRELSPYKNIRINPRRVNSLKKNFSCKNMYLKSSLFNSNNKIINSTSKKLSSKNDFNNYKNINDKSKRKYKSKNKKSINNNITKNDCVNIIKLKSLSPINNEDTKDNKDENKMSKNIKKFFCCI